MLAGSRCVKLDAKSLGKVLRAPVSARHFRPSQNAGTAGLSPETAPLSGTPRGAA